MTTIAVVAGGLVAVAAYSYVSTPAAVQRPDSRFQEQTPANPSGYTPQAGPSTQAGPTPSTPAAPAIPQTIISVKPAPVIPPATSIPASGSTITSISAKTVPTECAMVKPDGTGGFRTANTYGKNAAQCAAYNAEMAILTPGNTGNTYAMLPSDRVTDCVIS